MFRMFGLSPDLLALHRGKVNENILKRYGGIDDFKWVIRKLRDTSMIGLGHELLAIENMMFLLQRTLQAKQPLTADAMMIQRISEDPSYIEDDTERRKVLSLKVAISHK